MGRISVLKQINELWDERESATRDRKAEIDRELPTLGAQLENPRRTSRIESLQKKGERLTYDDVQYLKSQDFPDKTIWELMGISAVAFRKFTKNHKKKRAVNMGKTNLDEAKRLLAETDLTVTEIANETGATYGSIYYHVSKIRGKKENKSKNLKNSKEVVPESKKELLPMTEEKSTIYTDLEDTTKNLKETIIKMTEDHERFKAETTEEREKLEKKVAELKASPNPDESTQWFNLYMKEQTAHRLLFQYLKTVQEGDE